ncbi:hypothetical protein BDV98DRAFT_565606 [Pterulicium gracile]|uniref:Uncharacterized protein n=1 Tax=Pterulicium gracile TaxID=1884261 RepID=A0A5C3QK41_9AGAR|nr:hypothetical protein BDV98DRAFT_565606 [Pterula gracilis]
MFRDHHRLFSSQVIIYLWLLWCCLAQCAPVDLRLQPDSGAAPPSSLQIRQAPPQNPKPKPSAFPSGLDIAGIILGILGALSVMFCCLRNRKREIANKKQQHHEEFGAGESTSTDSQSK